MSAILSTDADRESRASMTSWRPMWLLGDVIDALEAGVQRLAAELDAEQSVRGIDFHEEVALHALLERILREAGYGVFREQRYPADRRRRKVSEGERCDFVLTPEGRPLAHPEQALTLFKPANALPLDEALWLEVKVVHQWTSEGPNGRYARELLSSVRQDVTKLSKERGILHAAALLVLFTAEQRVADHDLQVWQDKCLQRGLPIETPYRRHVPITDRLGNTLCTISLAPVRHL